MGKEIPDCRPHQPYLFTISFLFAPVRLTFIAIFVEKSKKYLPTVSKTSIVFLVDAAVAELADAQD
ncbi:MAG: hypothetical protein Q3978_06680 [Limosilactobacillus gorillae]|jgi:hypothetical protein|nr:hypothetical protein [Limosilactobacillus gorillae]